MFIYLFLIHIASEIWSVHSKIWLIQRKYLFASKIFKAWFQKYCFSKKINCQPDHPVETRGPAGPYQSKRRSPAREVRGALGSNISAMGRRRPRRVRFWRLVFLSFSLFEVLRESYTRPITCLSSWGFLKEDRMCLVDIRLFTGANVLQGVHPFSDCFELCFSEKCSFIFLHICTFYNGKTCKCAVTVFTTSYQKIPKSVGWFGQKKIKPTGTRNHF